MLDNMYSSSLTARQNKLVRFESAKFAKASLIIASKAIVYPRTTIPFSCSVLKAVTDKILFKSQILNL